MTPNRIHAAATSSTRQPAEQRAQNYASTSKALDFTTIGRAPGRLSLATRRLTSRDLEVVEATSELLATELPSPDPSTSEVSLLRGFNATIPSSERGKLRRRKMRHVDTEPLGLKQMGLNARGLLTDDAQLAAPGHKRHAKRGRESLSATVQLGRSELERQTEEILLDRDNIEVRRVCAPVYLFDHSSSF